MARPKSLGAYAPLSATYYLDDAILEAGEAAELLFVRSLSFLATSASDGFITERQMHSVVGMGMRKVTERVAGLLRVGLFEAVEGGYVVRSWLKWNKSTEEIGKHLRRDRDRKAAAKAGNTGEKAGIPDGIQMDSSGELDSSAPDSSDQYTTHHDTSVHDTSVHTPQAAELALIPTVTFDDFWKIWPRNEGKADARKAWDKATRKLSPEEILTAAHAYVTHPHRPATQFVPHGSTWLNGERWSDGPPVTPEAEKRKPSKEDELVSILALGHQMQQDIDRKAVGQ